MRTRKIDYEYEEEMCDNEDEIDLMELVMMARRGWKIIAVIAAAMTIIGIGVAMTRSTIYKSTASLMVSTGGIYGGAKSIDGETMRINQGLVTTYSEIAKSPALMKSIIRKLDLDYTPDQLSKVITVSPVDDTEIIKISATDKNALRSSQITNETVKEFMVKIREVMNFENLKVVEAAEVPTQALPKKRALIIAISMVLGTMIGTGVVLLIEMMHSKLRKPEDIEKILGCSVLTYVPDYSQAEEISNMDETSKTKKLQKLQNIGKVAKVGN